MRFVEVFTPLPDALSPLPLNLITELRTFRVPDCQRLSSTATRLQRLHIEYAAHLEEAAQALERLPSLTRLHNSGCFAAAADLAPLWRLTRLHALGISGVRQDVLFEALPALSTMPLRHLSAHGCTDAGLAALLPAVRALTSLDCNFDRPSQPNLMCQQQLQLLTQLQELQLWNSQLAAVPASLPVAYPDCIGSPLPTGAADAAAPPCQPATPAPPVS